MERIIEVSESHSLEDVNRRATIMSEHSEKGLIHAKPILKLAEFSSVPGVSFNSPTGADRTAMTEKLDMMFWERDIVHGQDEKSISSKTPNGYGMIESTTLELNLKDIVLDRYDEDQRMSPVSLPDDLRSFETISQDLSLWTKLSSFLADAFSGPNICQH